AGQHRTHRRHRPITSPRISTSCSASGWRAPRRPRCWNKPTASLARPSGRAKPPVSASSKDAENNQHRRTQHRKKKESTQVAKKGQRLQRLDAELVRRKIARSREQAQKMIKEGRVHVNGMLAQKPATGVNADVSIRVTDSEEDHWASRGAHKLLGALAAFEPQGLSLDGKRVLDAGASTGGFTDVALDRGASEVLAVDV